MKQLSIEYAHIYTNTKIGHEHKLSIDLLKSLRKNPEAESLVVMVDDYSFPDPSFDYDEFTKYLAQHGQKPDLMIRESQLIPACDEVLRHVTDQKIKEQLIDYVKAKKYPCSLFIAAWYLIRLGYIEFAGFNETLVAERVINILPESFKPFEDKGLEIIGATPFAEAVGKIEYKFFDGRLIA